MRVYVRARKNSIVVSTLVERGMLNVTYAVVF